METKQSIEKSKENSNPKETETPTPSTVENPSSSYKESNESFMQIMTREIMSCLEDKENQKCFDCNESPANWVCVNNSIFLCGKCAGKHRGYGPIISNLKFLMLDQLNEFQIEILKTGGNKRLKDLLIKYKIDINKCDNLILFSSRLLEYHRNCLYNNLAGKNLPEEPSFFSKTFLKPMDNFKEIQRPPLEKPVKNKNGNNKNNGKDNINDDKNINSSSNNDGKGFKISNFWNFYKK